MIGMLVAAEIILSRFLSISRPALKISLAFLPVLFAGMLFGPLRAGLTGAAADVLGAALFPTGPYFPGFTLTAFASGAVYGLFLYRKNITLKRAFLSAVIVSLGFRLGLDTLWLRMLYGGEIPGSVRARVITCLVMPFVITAFAMILGYPCERVSLSLARGEAAELRARMKLFFREHAPEIPDISGRIAQKCLQLPEYLGAKTVFCFVGMKDRELDTAQILRQALADGKRVCVPVCGEEGAMTARGILSMDDLSRKGRYGIVEPAEDAPLVEKEEIDIAFIPCSAADLKHNRIGKGGGYYDRYLADGSFFKAGICPDALVRRNVPSAAHDVPLDLVITETRVF